MLKIITDPNPILHKQSKKITLFDNDLKHIIEDMAKAIHDNKGLGISAPQIGKSIQLAVIDLPKDLIKNEQDEAAQRIVLINPKILSVSKAKISQIEGCLSLPNLEVNVTRPIEIAIEWSDENEIKHSLAAKGLLARVMQHEIDHLNGILITDYGQAYQPKN